MSDEEKALVPVEQKQVQFYDDELTAVKGEDGRVYAVISHMCDALGIDTQGQTRRIQRQQVLDRGYTWVDILSTQGDVTQRRRVQVLRVDLVPLWLTGISTRSIKDEQAREKLLRYQEEAADVLWEAFQEGRLTVGEEFEDLLQVADPDLVQAYHVAQAVVRLARNQILLEARLGDRIEDHERRLEELETTLGDPDRVITPAQATHLSQAVKAIAMKLSEKTGRNEFGGVWGEFYRQFEIPTYRELPAAKFDEAMAFLTDWWQQVAGTDDVPF
jgi:hypothetical protein